MVMAEEIGIDFGENGSGIRVSSAGVKIGGTEWGHTAVRRAGGAT